MAAAISLYLDEGLSPKIAEQLRMRGIEAITAQDLGLLGGEDSTHLARAATEGRTIGDWVRDLELVRFVYSADEMANHVEYL